VGAESSIFAVRRTQHRLCARQVEVGWDMSHPMARQTRDVPRGTPEIADKSCPNRLKPSIYGGLQVVQLPSCPLMEPCYFGTESAFGNPCIGRTSHPSPGEAASRTGYRQRRELCVESTDRCASPWHESELLQRARFDGERDVRAKPAADPPPASDDRPLPVGAHDSGAMVRMPNAVARA